MKLDDFEVESYGSPYERTEKLLEDASMDEIFEVFSDLSLTYRKRIVIALKAQDHLELGEAFADAWQEHAKQVCEITP